MDYTLRDRPVYFPNSVCSVCFLSLKHFMSILSVCMYVFHVCGAPWKSGGAIESLELDGCELYHVDAGNQTQALFKATSALKL